MIQTSFERLDLNQNSSGSNWAAGLLGCCDRFYTGPGPAPVQRRFTGSAPVHRFSAGSLVQRWFTGSPVPGFWRGHRVDGLPRRHTRLGFPRFVSWAAGLPGCGSACLLGCWAAWLLGSVADRFSAGSEPVQRRFSAGSPVQRRFTGSICFGGTICLD